KTGAGRWPTMSGPYWPATRPPGTGAPSRSPTAPTCTGVTASARESPPAGVSEARSCWRSGRSRPGRRRDRGGEVEDEDSLGSGHVLHAEDPLGGAVPGGDRQHVGGAEGRLGRQGDLLPSHLLRPGGLALGVGDVVPGFGDG